MRSMHGHKVTRARQNICDVYNVGAVLTEALHTSEAQDAKAQSRERSLNTSIVFAAALRSSQEGLPPCPLHDPKTLETDKS